MPVFLRGRRRDFLRDQLHRVVEQHAERLAGFFVVQDFSAERIRRFRVDPGEFQRLAVRDCAVAIGALEENRIVRSDLVELFAG